MKPCIRIIGGTHRSKKIYFPYSEGLRPTPDRIKETLFNWLRDEIRGARCLDAFAGSGSLGFEAFSRGASHVMMVESSPIAFKALQQNALSFCTPILTLSKKNVLEYLETIEIPYDIIFLDPPFQKNYLVKCLQIIEKGRCLTPNGLLYIESPTKMTVDFNIWSERKSKKAGQVFYGLYERVTQ